MRIAMPADDKTIEGNVCISFGRAPYFLVYDTDTKESVFLDNEAAASQGGAGIKAAQSVADSKVDALITPRCGQNAADVIYAAKIKIYKTVNNSIMENLAAFEDGKLEVLNEIHSGFHGHGA